MSDSITIRGFVATEVRSSTTPGGIATASFRMGSTDRHYDRASGAWVDGHTNWFSVQCYRQLAGNIGGSLKKGQRVIVVGRLKLRSWEKEGRIYHATEIESESVGHDLMWGSANYMRNTGTGGQASADQQPHEATGSSPDFLNGGDPEAGRDADSGEDDPASAVFVEDEGGELSLVDTETGELTEAV